MSLRQEETGPVRHRVDASPVRGERVLVDEEEDHVGTARRAHQDARINAWLPDRSRAPAL